MLESNYSRNLDNLLTKDHLTVIKHQSSITLVLAISYHPLWTGIANALVDAFAIYICIYKPISVY